METTAGWSRKELMERLQSYRGLSSQEEEEQQQQRPLHHGHHHHGNHTADRHHPYQGCSELFIGAGWGGVYSFYRRVLDGVVFHNMSASHYCLIEQTNRIGGRTYSVPIDHEYSNGITDFVLDVGADHFTPDMHLVGDLILHHLQLMTECYEPGCPPPVPPPPQQLHQDDDDDNDDNEFPLKKNYTAPFRRIIDPISGLPSGFDSALRTMVELCQGLGARVFLNTKLVQFQFHVPTKNNNNNNNSNNNNNHADNEQPNLLLVVHNTVTGIRSTIQSGSTTSTRSEDDDDDDDETKSSNNYNYDTQVVVLVLNLPRHELFQVQGMKESLDEDVVKTLECIVHDDNAVDYTSKASSSSSVHDSHNNINNNNNLKNADTSTIGKAYLYYEDAWWHTKLNQTVGTWPTNVGHGAVNTPQGVLLNVHWNDGPVHCHRDIGDNNDDDDDDKLSTTTTTTTTSSSCRGFLEVYYSISNESFYSSLPKTMHDEQDDWNNNNNNHKVVVKDDPLGMLWVKDSPHGRLELDLVHEALMQSLEPLWNQSSNLWNLRQSIAPPTGLVVGIWQLPPHPPQFPLGMGWTAPTKLYYDPTMQSLEHLCGVPGLTQETYRDLVLQPFDQNDYDDNLLATPLLWHRRQRRTRRRLQQQQQRTTTASSNKEGKRPFIFVVNNDFVCNSVNNDSSSSSSFRSWVEEPLLQAERALYIMGTPKPSWLIDSYYQTEVVRQVSIRHDSTTTTTMTTTLLTEPPPSSPPIAPVSVGSLPAQRGLIPLLVIIGMVVLVMLVELYRNHHRNENETEKKKDAYTSLFHTRTYWRVLNHGGDASNQSDTIHLRKYNENVDKEVGETCSEEGSSENDDKNNKNNNNNDNDREKQIQEYDSQELWQLHSVAILVSYWVVGTSVGLFRSFLNVYPLDIGANEAQQTTLATLSALPAAFNILYGFTSDTVPICGYRRKPYLFLAWLLSSMAMLFLYASSDLTLERRPAPKAYDDMDDFGGQHRMGEIVLVPEGAPSLTKLSACAFVFGFGLWFASCMTDAVVAEKARHEPDDMKGSLQSSCYIVRFFGLMVAAPFSTFLYAKVGPEFVVQILVWVPCLVFPALWCYVERKEEVKPVREQCEEIWYTICSRSVWEPMAFMFFFNLLQVSNAAWRQFLVTVYGFTAANLNTVLVVSYVLLCLGTILYKYCLLQTSWRKIYQACLFLNLIFSVLQFLLIKDCIFGISPFVFAMGDDAVVEFLNGIQFLPSVMMMVSLCPTGSEVMNTAWMISNAISSLLLGIWDVGKETLEHGNLDGMFKLSLLTTFIQFTPLLFIHWLPHGQEDLKALSSRPYSGSPLGGFAVLFLLFGSMALSLAVAILNIVCPGWAGGS